MNKERMIQLAVELETRAESKHLFFYMGSVQISMETLLERYSSSIPESEYHCGSACCIKGLIESLWIEGKIYVDSAEKWLDITHKQSQDLFFPDGSSPTNRDIWKCEEHPINLIGCSGAKEAAKTVRNAIALWSDPMDMPNEILDTMNHAIHNQ